MRYVQTAAVAGCAWCLMTLLVSPAGLGSPAAVECFGLPATIVGSEGADVLIGTDGDDVVAGLGGDDAILGFGGNDALCGGPGDDGLVPGLGDDRIDGGGGGVGLGFLDVVLFDDLDQSAQPVRVDLRAGTATGEGADKLMNVHGLSGTRFGDTLIGDDSLNAFWPRDGDDTIVGGGGEDAVGFRRGVSANLATGAATGEGADRLDSVESLYGSKFRDVLVGNAAANYLSAGEGDDDLRGEGGDDRAFGDAGSDRLVGGGGNDSVGGDQGNDRVVGGSGDDVLSGGDGNDVVDGGAGLDAITYRPASSGIQANLLVGRAIGRGLDTLAGIEQIEGSELPDQLLGDAKTNFLVGNAGSDSITAAAGNDFLDGGTGANSLSDGQGRDYCLERAGARGCEIVGVPGRVPAIPDRAPALRQARIELSSSRRSPVVMPVPGAYQALLRSYRERFVRTFSGDAPPRGVSGDSGWSFESPLLRLLVSATPPGTGPFRYSDQPSCFSERRPYRTTVAPPVPIQPARSDGANELVLWRGVLFRKDRGVSKLVRVKATPWVAGLVQAPGAPTGYPVWRSADLKSSAPQRFSFTVPRGEYVWVGALKWVRTGARLEEFIEPHIVRAGRVQPDKSCNFAGGG
jgi:Ca2+-binding RTX toxin-like protein